MGSLGVTTARCPGSPVAFEVGGKVAVTSSFHQGQWFHHKAPPCLCLPQFIMTGDVLMRTP